MKKGWMVLLLIFVFLLTGCDAANTQAYAGTLPQQGIVRAILAARNAADAGPVACGRLTLVQERIELLGEPEKLSLGI